MGIRELSRLGSDEEKKMRTQRRKRKEKYGEICQRALRGFIEGVLEELPSDRY
jgi:hypothetical protein